MSLQCSGFRSFRRTNHFSSNRASSQGPMSVLSINWGPRPSVMFSQTLQIRSSTRCRLETFTIVHNSLLRLKAPPAECLAVRVRMAKSTVMPHRASMC